MKTEKQIIDRLGEWLCDDMMNDIENPLVDSPRFPSTDTIRHLSTVRAIAKKIQWYRDNVCVDATKENK